MIIDKLNLAFDFKSKYLPIYKTRCGLFRTIACPTVSCCIQVNISFAFVVHLKQNTLTFFYSCVYRYFNTEKFY